MTALEQEVMEAVVKEFEGAIQEAREGRLSPYWQQYHIRELSNYEPGVPFAEEKERLLGQMREVLDSTPQLSDFEVEKAALADRGLELLMDYSQDFGSLMEIVCLPEKQTYTCYVGLDGELTPEQAQRRVEDMKAYLNDWIQQNYHGSAPIAVVPYTKQMQKEYYDSMEEVLTYMQALLHAPEHL